MTNRESAVIDTLPDEDQELVALEGRERALQEQLKPFVAERQRFLAEAAALESEARVIEGRRDDTLLLAAARGSEEAQQLLAEMPLRCEALRRKARDLTEAANLFDAAIMEQNQRLSTIGRERMELRHRRLASHAEAQKAAYQDALATALQCASAFVEAAVAVEQSRQQLTGQAPERNETPLFRATRYAFVKARLHFGPNAFHVWQGRFAEQDATL
jgi:hypothetical protein